MRKLYTYTYKNPVFELRVICLHRGEQLQVSGAGELSTRLQIQQ